MTERIESALSFIGANDRELWVSMAMAVKSEIGEAGFELWDRWSQRSDSYKTASALSVWRSCRGSGVTIGSLFHAAKQAGWRDDDKYVRPSADQIRAQKAASAERMTAQGIEREAAAQRAGRKAEWIIRQCNFEQHAYLDSKGFPELQGMVWRPNEQSNILIIPMRIGGNIVGAQMINKDGEKKFITGQRTACATYTIDNKGPHVLCEGYATAMSIQAALSSIKMRYTLHVCFSAGNLVKVAAALKPGFVIADNDASTTGQNAAEATGWRYYMPPEVGDDFNDLHKREGTFRASQILRKAMM